MKQYILNPIGLCLMVLHLVAVNAVAQEQARTFQTLCYFPVKDQTKLSYIDREKVVEVELPRMNLSPIYQLKTGGGIRFGDVKKVDGKLVVTNPKAQVKLPTGAKHCLLLFLPAGKNSKLPYQVIAINYDTTAFQYGESVFYNLSNESVAGVFGKKKLSIPPKKKSQLNLANIQKKDNRYYVDIRSKINGQWRPLCKTYWNYDPEVRKLVLIFRDEKTKRLRLLSFPDRKIRKTE